MEAVKLHIFVLIGNSSQKHQICQDTKQNIRHETEETMSPSLSTILMAAVSLGTCLFFFQDLER